MSQTSFVAPVRERLLRAGSQLLEDAAEGEVSTRAVCELAGVQAPALYHHFGSKQGLLDEVVSVGFRRFLEDWPGADGTIRTDPTDAIREAWDIHVEFGLEHPRPYGHIHALTGRETPCKVIGEIEDMILAALEPAAVHGRLTMPPAQAARMLLATSSGVVLALIAHPKDPSGHDLSRRTRDGVLSAITRPELTTELRLPDVASTAIALSTALSTEGSPLGPAETSLLQAWLDRLSHRPASLPPEIASIV